jgi:phosphohistidine phosphatase
MNYKQISIEEKMADAVHGQKILYFLRHAKAETSSSTAEDHERGLTERGIEACAIMGRYLVHQVIVPDKVLCSTAQRAEETWKLVEKAYKKAPPVEFYEKLYLASANEILNLIAQVPEEVEKLMLVGHNPGLHQLCLQLAKSGDSKLVAALIIKFPTCAVASIAFDNMSWVDIARMKGELTGFVTPKMLATKRW